MIANSLNHLMDKFVAKILFCANNIFYKNVMHIV
jgi:hypothetical protein